MVLFITNAKIISQKEVYLKKSCVLENDTINYRLLVPNNYNENKKYPMLVFLHGAGERGNDNELQLIHGSSLFTSKKNRNKYNSFIVFPQCPKDNYWATIIETHSKNRNFKYSPNPISNLQLSKVEFLMKDLENNYNIDEKRIYVGGLSMGGMGTFEMVYRNPNKFAAAFAICGGANPKIAEQISSTSWFIYHGTDDKVVPVEHSQKIANALKETKSNIKYIQYEGVNHNSWDKAFREKNFLKSIYKKRRK